MIARFSRSSMNVPRGTFARNRAFSPAPVRAPPSVPWARVSGSALWKKGADSAVALSSGAKARAENEPGRGKGFDPFRAVRRGRWQRERTEFRTAGCGGIRAPGRGARLSEGRSSHCGRRAAITNSPESPLRCQRSSPGACPGCFSVGTCSSKPLRSCRRGVGRCPQLRP